MVERDTFEIVARVRVSAEDRDEAVKKGWMLLRLAENLINAESWGVNVSEVSGDASPHR